MANNGTRTSIPGNRVSEFGRIYSDTTLVALEGHLRNVVNGQAANRRTNPRYVAEVLRLRKAIASRSN